MDRGAWRAIVHESQRDRHDLATEHKHEAYLHRKFKRFIGKIKINKDVYKVIRNKIYIRESTVSPYTANKQKTYFLKNTIGNSNKN